LWNHLNLQQVMWSAYCNIRSFNSEQQLLLQPQITVPDQSHSWSRGHQELSVSVCSLHRCSTLRMQLYDSLYGSSQTSGSTITSHHQWSNFTGFQLTFVSSLNLSHDTLYSNTEGSQLIDADRSPTIPDLVHQMIFPSERQRSEPSSVSESSGTMDLQFCT